MIAPSLITVLGLLAASASAQSNSVLSRHAQDVQRFAAIGDSFAAGIGSGNSYHTLFNLLKDQYGQTIWHFENLACSGATSPEILKNQAQKLVEDDLAYNLITISAGGNDGGFSDLVARCFYVVDGPDEEQPMNNCDAAFETTKKIIESSKFKDNLIALIKTAQGALHPDGHILVTGYARFFDASTSACNDVTWAGYKPTYAPIFLSKDLRQRANNMVDDVNKIIREIAESEPNAVFIDINDARKDLKPYCGPGVDESHKKPDGQKWETPSDAQFWQIEWTRRENGAFDMPSIIWGREFSWSNIIPTDWFEDAYKRTFHPSVQYHRQIGELLFEKYKGCLAARQPEERSLRFSKRRTKRTIACDRKSPSKGDDKKSVDLTGVIGQIGDVLGSAALKTVDVFLEKEMPKNAKLEDWVKHLAPKEATKLYDDIKKEYAEKTMPKGIKQLYAWLSLFEPESSSSKDDKNDSSKDNKDDSSEEKAKPYVPPELQHPAASMNLTELGIWERRGVGEHQAGKCVYSVSKGGNLNVFAWDLKFLGPGTAEGVDADKKVVSEGNPWNEGGMRPLIFKHCHKKSGYRHLDSHWDEEKGYTEQGSKRGWGRFMFFFRWAANRCGENVLLSAATEAQKHIIASQAAVRYMRARNYPSSQVLSDADRAIIRQDTNRELAEMARNPAQVFGPDFKCKKVSHADHEAAKDHPPNDVDNGPAAGPDDVHIEL